MRKPRTAPLWLAIALTAGGLLVGGVAGFAAHGVSDTLRHSCRPDCTIVSGAVTSVTGQGPTVCVKQDGGQTWCAEARLSKLPDTTGFGDSTNQLHGYLPPVGQRVSGVWMRLVEDTDAPDPTHPAWVYFKPIQ
jgi:hypothetical protein